MTAARGGGGGEGGGGPRRPRRRLRRWVVRPAVWALALISLVLAGAWFFAQTDYAHQRLRRLLEARLTELLGRPVSIAAVDYGFAPASFIARGVTVPGPEPGDPDFARIEQVRLEAAVKGFRRVDLDIYRVTVVRPVVELVLYPDGRTNLPEIRTQGGGGGGRVEVRFGALSVTDGVVRFDDREIPLSIDAEQVWGRLEGPPGALNAGRDQPPRFDVNLAARDVVIRLPDARPYTGSLAARGTVTGGEIALAMVRIGAPEVTATASGRITWGDGGTEVALDVDARGEAALVNRLGYLDEPVRGRFEATGGFTSGAGAWRWHADLRSPAAEMLDRRATDLVARLDGDRDGVQVRLDEAAYAGGRATGTLAIATGTDPVPMDLELRLLDASVEPLLADLGLEIAATGRADADLTYRFTSAAPLDGNGFGAVRLTGAHSPSRGRPAVPVSGQASLAIDAGVLSSDAILLEAPGQRAVGSATVDLDAGRGRLAFTLATEDLGRLTPLVPGADDPDLAPWLPVAGRGTVEGELAFGPRGMTGPIRFDLRDPAVEAARVDRAAGSLRLAPEAVEELRVEAGTGGGALIVTGRLPFTDDTRPAEAAGAGLQLDFDAADWPIASLGFLFPEAVASLEPAGSVSGRLTLTGSYEALAGTADLVAAPLTAAGVELERVAAVLAFDPATLAVERLETALPAGEATASGTWDLAGGGLDFAVRASGIDLAAEPFGERVPGELGGVVEARATVGGTLDDPRVAATVTAERLTLAGAPLGDDGGARLDGTWADGRVEVTGSLLGLIAFSGGGPLDPETPETADLAFEVSSERLASLVELATGVALEGLTGELRGTLAVRGEPAGAGSGSGFGVSLELGTLVASYQGHRIENLDPVAVRLDGERLVIDSLYVGETAGGPGPSELFVGGAVDFGGEAATLDLHLQSSLPAAWAELVYPDADVEGSLELLATVRGTLDSPEVNGQGEVRDGELILPGFPHGFDELTATVLFYPTQVVLDSLSADFAGGTVRAAGRLGLGGLSEGQPLDYRFQAGLDGVSLRYPEGFLLRGDAELTLSSTADGRVLAGGVDLERVFYLQDVPVGLTQLLQKMLQRERLEAGETDPILASTHLTVSVHGPDALRVRNNVANFGGDVDLVVRGTLANPVIFGQVEIDPGGTVVYLDNTYEIERGLLTFANPYRIDPVIDLSATTEVRDYDVTLQLSGTLERLDATFVSDPPLADLDVLALLTTGRPLEGGQLFDRSQTEQSQGGAQTFLYGQAASVVSERVNTLFGFDRFRVNPVVGTSGESTAVAFTVGKQLSRDLYVTYSRDPSSSLDYVLQAEWRVHEGVTLVLTQNGDRSFAVDVLLERRF